ncbi:MAG: alpha/beta hydrolase [Sphingomonadales bacterium]|nr:alpha/beta hydrolase [Sphingomonadales bacterium]
MSRAAATALAVTAAAALAQSAPAPAPTPTPGHPTFAADGTVHVPAFDLPPSALSSPEAQRFMTLRAQVRMPALFVDDIAKNRMAIDAMMGSQIGAMKALYPVDITEGTIAGVPVRIVTPHGRATDPARVLINLHGGAFSVCWGSCSLLESIPIAGLGGYKVISVNYRMAPEARHPAAVEDAAAVYRALLRHYAPRHIGVYGCSAGGALTAQLAAWLPGHGLPQMGAAGIFGAGGVRFMAGDSAWIAANIDGSFPAPPRAGETAIDMTHGYFTGANMADPIISPALHPAVIARFPPTLLITGTRAMDLSPAIVTNSALVKAHVPSELIVGEGMGHCYMYMPGLPEARDAHRAIVDFFRRELQ